ncbi:MAG: TonB-dependent receptor, partial [Pigmentiphaga sp.]|nr:TonB-dependent receptor [Pigmentiphaga sp.]
MQNSVHAFSPERGSLPVCSANWTYLMMPPTLLPMPRAHSFARPRFPLHPLIAALGLCLTPLAVSAQTPATPEMEDVSHLETVHISASGLQTESTEMTQPVSVINEGALTYQSRSSLGETLEKELGVSSTHFGAGASRPIIRGQDAARVKVLSDSVEVQDASTMSPDHAVGVEPMLARRIEVLRGTSTLRYGGGAIGGVVNVLDHKIPDYVPDGVEGEVALRYGSGAKEKAGAFGLTAGAGEWAFHAEGLRRRSDDYRVGKGWSGGRRVPGSYQDTDTVAVGFSRVTSQGYWGLAYTQQNNTYGLPGHDHSHAGCHPHGNHLHCGGHDHDDHGDHDHDHDHDHGVPHVDLKSHRWDLRGEQRNPLPGIERLQVRAGLTNYRHHELEEGAVMTTFRNKAHDARVELTHEPLGGLRGMVGVQTTRRDFSALGEEAYIDPTVTQTHGVYLLEEYRWGPWRFEGGVRHERQSARETTSGTKRTHAGTSLSLGASWSWTPGYSLGVSLARSQRLPSAEELYADGLHMATATYERGNRNLGKETFRQLDVQLRKTSGRAQWSVGAFYNDASNYISPYT